MTKVTRNVTKQLITAEDMLLGRGSVVQQRGGNALTVHKLDLFLPLDDESELGTTDTAKYPKASVGSKLYVAVNGEYQELSNVEPIVFKVGGMLDADYPYCCNLDVLDVIAKWEGVFPKILTALDADFSTPGWTIVQSAEWTLRDQLATIDSTVPVGGVPAGVLAARQFSVINILDFIPKSQWAAIKNFTSVYDASDAFQAAMNSDGYVHIFAPVGRYRITKTLNVTTQVTITGPSGGSQSMQHTRIYHDPASTGPLFNLKTLVNGACIKNLYISGGNGSTCISSELPQTIFERLYWFEYNGGGIELLPTGTIGASSARIYDCEWLGMNAPTNHIGYKINLNGGDVHLRGLVAIRGAVGIDVVQGQTITIDGCSVNKQSVYNEFSSLPGTETAGIRLSSAGYKQAVSIRGCYVEACTNGILVDGCEALQIENNFIQDVGVSGVVGLYEQFGNHSIRIKGAAKNVKIDGNVINATSNGKFGVDAYYCVRVDSGAENVYYGHNSVTSVGDNSAHYRFDTEITWLSNKYTIGSNPGPSVGETFINDISKAAKACVQFNGNGGAVIGNNYGVVSVVRTAVGTYTVTTLRSFPSAVVNVEAENTSVQLFFFKNVTQTSNTTFVITTGTSVSTLADARQISFAILN